MTEEAAQEKLARSEPGGDAAAGSQRIEVPAAVKVQHQACADIVENVRATVENGNMMLQRQRRSISTIPIREGKENLQVGFWESSKLAAMGCLCCHSSRRKMPDLPAAPKRKESPF